MDKEEKDVVEQDVDQNTTTDETTKENKTVPYNRFKEKNEEVKQLKDQLRKYQEDDQKRNEESMKEQNKWKELFVQKEAELKSERSTRLKLQVATEKGLPVEIASRLIGETEDEIRADAEKMASLLKVQTNQTTTKTPGVPPVKENKTNEFDMSKMTPEEIRKNAEKLIAGLRS